jgi:hypothetical protein
LSGAWERGLFAGGNFALASLLTGRGRMAKAHRAANALRGNDAVRARIRSRTIMLQ